MLSSKLLPEMEIGDNTKREQLLNGMENLPVSMQFEKLKVSDLIVDQSPLNYPYHNTWNCPLLYYFQTITDKIGAAWEGSNDACISIHTKRLRPIVLPTINKVQDAKIREQENLLRSAVNDGEGVTITALQAYLLFCLCYAFCDSFPVILHNFLRILLSNLANAILLSTFLQPHTWKIHMLSSFAYACLEASTI